MHHELQNLRLSKGLTRQQLAQNLKVSTQTISLLENGLLIRIASFFNVSMDYLLGHQNELLEIYNSLDNINKGRLLEMALNLAEKSNEGKKKDC